MAAVYRFSLLYSIPLVCVAVFGVTAAEVESSKKQVTVKEGSPAYNFGSYSPSHGALSSTVGEVSAVSAAQWLWSYTPLDGPANSQSVSVAITDNDGNTAGSEFSLEVENVAPSIIDVNITGERVRGAPIQLLALATDPGILDSLSGVITWGDGSETSDSFTSVGDINVLTSSHAFEHGGNFTLLSLVTDNDGGADSDAKQITVAHLVSLAIDPIYDDDSGEDETETDEEDEANGDGGDNGDEDETDGDEEDADEEESDERDPRRGRRNRRDRRRDQHERRRDRREDRRERRRDRREDRRERRRSRGRGRGPPTGRGRERRGGRFLGLRATEAADQSPLENMLSVSVLSDQYFDATSVAVRSLRVGTGPVLASGGGCVALGDGEPKDINGDGLVDFHFNCQGETGASSQDALADLQLIGRDVNWIPLVGSTDKESKVSPSASPSPSPSSSPTAPPSSTPSASASSSVSPSATTPPSSSPSPTATFVDPCLSDVCAPGCPGALDPCTYGCPTDFGCGWDEEEEAQ